jgi:nucleotide-binding universal stress UspA family protein
MRRIPNVRTQAGAQAVVVDCGMPARASQVRWTFGSFVQADSIAEATASTTRDSSQESLTRARRAPWEERRPAIVCGVDDSVQARRALDTTVDLARRIDVRPVIVRVGQAPMWRDTEHAELVAWAASSNPPQDTEYKIVYGLPAESLVCAAKEIGALLIVVGSRARGRIATALRGSSSAGVIAQSAAQFSWFRQQMPKPASRFADT